MSRARMQRYEHIGALWSEQGAGKTAADDLKKQEVGGVCSVKSISTVRSRHCNSVIWTWPYLRLCYACAPMNFADKLLR